MMTNVWNMWEKLNPYRRRIAWLLVASLLVPMFFCGEPVEVLGESAGSASGQNKVGVAQVETLGVESPAVETEEIVEPVGTPDVWDGTADTSWYVEGETEFEIYTAEQLAGLAKLSNEGKLGKNIGFLLMQDIYLNANWNEYANWGKEAPENKWMPIGTEESPYEGAPFDGNGHTIYGMYVKEEENAGLFGKVKPVSILNVNVRNSYVGGNQCVGGIVGSGESVGFYQCSNGAIVKGDTYVGGLCGEVLQGTSDIRECYNIGEISGNMYVGGLFGKTACSWYFTCYNTGDVTGTEYVGGIGGSVVFSSKYSPSISAFVTGNVEGSEYAGAFAGQFSVHATQIENNSEYMIYYLKNQEVNAGLNAFGCDQDCIPIEFSGGGHAEDDFVSGYIAYQLGEYGFGQTIGKDLCPVIKNESNVVHKVTYVPCWENGTYYENTNIETCIYVNEGAYVEAYVPEGLREEEQVEGWYTSNSFQYVWDFDTLRIRFDRNIYMKIVKVVLPTSTTSSTTASPTIMPTMPPVPVKPTDDVYEVSFDWISEHQIYDWIVERTEYTTDPEGRPCLKIQFDRNYERLFFELPDVVDLSDYDRYEIVAYVPNQMQFSTWESGVLSNPEPAEWYEMYTFCGYPFREGSFTNESLEIADSRENAERGIEIQRKEMEIQEGRQLTYTKYVSVGANSLIAEGDYYIYAIRFLKKGYEGETGIPTAVPTQTPVPMQTEDSATPTTSLPQESQENAMVPPVATSAPKKAKVSSASKKLKKPVIRLSKGRTSLGKKCVRIKVKKYAGKYAEIYIRQKKGKFIKVKLSKKNSSIARNKKVFKLTYSKGGTVLYCKVRTYKLVKKKKRYSAYSKVKKIKL